MQEKITRKKQSSQNKKSDNVDKYHRSGNTHHSVHGSAHFNSDWQENVLKSKGK